jgi:hypothetical protein
MTFYQSEVAYLKNAKGERSSIFCCHFSIHERVCPIWDEILNMASIVIFIVTHIVLAYKIYKNLGRKTLHTKQYIKHPSLLKNLFIKGIPNAQRSLFTYEFSLQKFF